MKKVIRQAFFLVIPFLTVFCLIFSPLHAEPLEKKINSVFKTSFLTAEQKAEIRKAHLEGYDSKFGGWGEVPKLINAAEMEYALVSAAGGDPKEKAMVLETLDSALLLIDPAEGGFYESSGTSDWKSPRYEKKMQTQAYAMRFYGMAGAVWNRPEYLKAARKTAEFIKKSWQDSGGAFYGRQEPGINFGAPNIDKGLHPHDNGLAILGLTAMYHATLEKEYLTQSLRAAEWVIKHRTLNLKDVSLLGFYQEAENEPFYLGDTLMMARAFLRLYASTGTREWLVKAVAAADFMEKNFKDAESGYLTAALSQSAGRIRDADENEVMARFANLLWHYSGKKEYRTMAEHAMRYLASPELLKSRKFNGGVLLADQELASEPIHVVVVGHKDDPAAQALFAAALSYPAGYKRLEWWDKREGPLPHPDVSYPQLPQAAAFACSGKVCSLPIFKPEKVGAQISRLRGKKK